MRESSEWVRDRSAGAITICPEGRAKTFITNFNGNRVAAAAAGPYTTEFLRITFHTCGNRTLSPRTLSGTGGGSLLRYMCLYPRTRTYILVFAVCRHIHGIDPQGRRTVVIVLVEGPCTGYTYIHKYIIFIR